MTCVRFRNLLLLLGGMLIAVSCVHQPPPEPSCPLTGVDSGPTVDCDPDIVYFERDVLPILASNCAKSGCHNDSTAAEDVILESYAQVMATADVDPCNAANSKLIRVLKGGDDDPMPPSGNTPLTAAQISLLEKWINQGAQDFTCKDDCETVAISFSTNIQPMISTNCSGCHSGSAPSGGISLTNYTEVMAEVNSGRLMGALTSSYGFVPMPPSGPLAACRVDMIEIWIAEGAQNN